MCALRSSLAVAFDFLVHGLVAYNSATTNGPLDFAHRPRLMVTLAFHLALLCALTGRLTFTCTYEAVRLLGIKERVSKPGISSLLYLVNLPS